MTEKIVDINRYDFPATTVFHFNYSLRPFILVRTAADEPMFIDLSCGECFPWEPECLEYSDLKFYTNENDEDFCGVAVIGEINY